jgi:hypothetical protein|tara:strand:+ start:2138 stop:2806 length:669 start_codon:yes stop_codon:yes gene_type:complete
MSIAKKEMLAINTTGATWAKADHTATIYLEGGTVKGKDVKGLFPMFVAAGVNSREQLLKTTAKNDKAPVFTVDDIDDFEVTLFKAKHPERYALSLMLKDDPRLDGSDVKDEDGKVILKRTYDEAVLSRKMKGTVSKDLRNRFAKWLKRQSNDDTAGGARVTGDFITRVTSAKADIDKAIKAADKGTQATYDTASMDAFITALEHTMSLAAAVHKTKVLPTEV